MTKFSLISYKKSLEKLIGNITFHITKRKTEKEKLYFFMSFSELLRTHDASGFCSFLAVMRIPA